MMEEHIAFIKEKIAELKGKKKEQKLTHEDKVLVDLLKETLRYIKANYTHQIALEVMQQNKNVIAEYQNYLDSNVRKYLNRLEILVESKEKSSSKRLDKKIEKTKNQLEQARDKKDKFQKDYKSILEEYKPLSTSNVLQKLFSNPKLTLVSRTSFNSPSNEFLKKDEETGEIRLNQPNIDLLFEVFKEHRSENLKKLLKIQEYEERTDISNATKIEFQNFIRKSIPENLQNANAHVLDRIIYYAQSPLQRQDIGGPVLGKFKPFEAIDDTLCTGKEEVINQVLDYLKIAQILESASQFRRQDLERLIGEKEERKIRFNTEVALDWDFLYQTEEREDVRPKR